MKQGELPDNSRQITLGEVYLNCTPLDEVNKKATTLGNNMTWSPTEDDFVIEHAANDYDDNFHNID